MIADARIIYTNVSNNERLKSCMLMRRMLVNKKLGNLPVKDMTIVNYGKFVSSSYENEIVYICHFFKLNSIWNEMRQFQNNIYIFVKIMC